MDTTPTSKLSCKRNKTKPEGKKENEFSGPFESISTPSNKTLQQDRENDDSPVYFPTTQEASEDVDVLWDWHSPQTSERRRKKQKRLLPIQSPKFPIKRHPSSNQSQNFDKLRNELKALQEELALPDDETCLCVSPQQEMEFKESESNNLVFEKEQDIQFDDLDIFNDSVDEQLVLFSQRVESDLLGKNQVNQYRDTKSNSLTYLCDNTDIDNLINKYNKKSDDQFGNIADDSFDAALRSFQVEDVEKPNTIKKLKVNFQRTVSDNQFNKNSDHNVIQTTSGKLEFHRTRSFELEAVRNQSNLSKSKLEEIERKRLEALARLESKRKQEICENKTIISPIKCSAEEIERKRLQAVAKLEAKRLENIIEKKRQEALKKLQSTRMKNASLVKSTLTKRL